jgi:hypothetical protein
MSLTRICKNGKPHVVAASDGRLTISVPIQIKRRSGRKTRDPERERDTPTRRPCNWRWPLGIGGFRCWNPASSRL